MSKLCWKCNRSHEDGSRFCPYCGAEFATDEESYQTDGRTISGPVAPVHYPTTTYKKPSALRYVIFAVIVGAVVLMAFSAISPLGSGSGSSNGPNDSIESGADITDRPATHAENWKSTIEDYPSAPGYKRVVIEMGVKNLTIKEFDTTDFDIALKSENWSSYKMPESQTCDSTSDIIGIGKVVHYKAVFKVASKDIDTIKLQTRSSMDLVFAYDGSISIR